MTEEEAIQNIIKSCEVMGWQIAIPKGEPDSNVDGLVIGTEEYINRTLLDEFDVDSNEKLDLDSSKITVVDATKLVGENPCLAENIRSGKCETLSVSWDYDDDANDIKQRKAILLYVPDISSHEHEHIELSQAEARKLRNWLDRFLKKACQKQL